MALLPIRIYDDPVLRETARPIEAIEPRHRALAMDMAETMYQSRGIGLAANQVGVTERMIVVDVEWGGKNEKKGAGRNPLALLNPEVLETSEQEEPYDEGCLSLPQLEGEVWRPRWIRVRYQTLDGQTVERETEGLMARCIQHEIDHLNGVMFIDHMETEARQQIAGQLARLRKMRQQTA